MQFLLSSSAIFGTVNYQVAIKLLAVLFFLATHVALSQNQSPAQVQSLIDRAKDLSESYPDSALSLVHEAESTDLSESYDSLRGSILMVKSTIYSYKGEYDQSTSYAYEALEHGRTYQNLELQYDALTNLGIDLMYQDEYEKSAEYFEEAYEVASQHGKPYRIGHAHNNLGLIAYYLGDPNAEQRHYEQALQIFIELGDQHGIGNAQLNLGTASTDRGDHESAERYYQQALVSFEAIGYLSAYGNTLQSMAENDLAAGVTRRAVSRAEEALQIFIDNDNKQDILYCYEILKNIYEDQEEFQVAYQYLNRYHELNEEIFNEEKAAQISDMQVKYETSQKEAQIERLSLENELLKQNEQRNYLLIMLIVVLVGLGSVVVVLRMRKIKADHLLQESQLDALKQRFLDVQNASSVEFSLTLEELNEKLFNPLTQREYETLQFALEGKSNREISELTFVSLSTVKFHLGNIYTKFGVANKKEVAEYVETKL